jgi:hypothetical protein
VGGEGNFPRRNPGARGTRHPEIQMRDLGYPPTCPLPVYFFLLRQCSSESTLAGSSWPLSSSSMHDAAMLAPLGPGQS